MQTFLTHVLPAGRTTCSPSSTRNSQEVLILGPDVPVDDALRLATVLDVQVPDLTVLLVSEPDPELLLQAMRAGIGISSARPPTPRMRVLLERACQSFATRHRQEQPKQAETKGRVIGVFSPRVEWARPPSPPTSQ